MSKSLIEILPRLANAVRAAGRKTPQILGLLSKRSMSAALKNPFDYFTHSGSKSNQDYFVCATTKDSSTLENPKEAARKAIESASASLAADKKFEKSGTTLTLAITINNKVVIASIGDSPAFLVFRDKDNGGEISIKLTQEHFFDDTNIAQQLTTEYLTKDGRGKTRYNGLSVPCLGHNYDPKISQIPPRIRMLDLEKIIKASGLDATDYKIFVASDGFTEIDLNSISLQQPRADFEVLDDTKKLKYNRNSSAGNIKADSTAKEMADIAIENGSQDNITVAAIKAEIKEKNNNEAKVIMVADGNGVNGEDAAKIAAEAVITSMNLQVYATSDKEPSPNITQPKLTNSVNDKFR